MSAQFISGDEIIKVLNGDHSALSAAFVWGDTPQGRNYWAELACGRRALTAEDKENLNKLLVEAAARRLTDD